MSSFRGSPGAATEDCFDRTTANFLAQVCHTVGQIMDLGDEPLLMRTCRGRHFDRFLCKTIATGLTVKNWQEINDTLKNT